MMSRQSRVKKPTMMSDLPDHTLMLPTFHPTFADSLRGLLEFELFLSMEW